MKVNTVGSRLATISCLSKIERSVLIGTVLGDGHLEHNGNGYRLQVLHSSKQREYVWWKYEQLRRWIPTQPTVLAAVDHRYHKTNLELRFRTRNALIFEEFHQLFYRKLRKIVPLHVAELLDALALAVWYMDDGGRRKDCRGMFLNTLSFTDREQRLLQAALFKRWNIETRLHWVQDGYRIYIPKAMALRFTKIVAPHIISSMYYKLPYDPVTTEPVPLERARRKVPDNQESRTFCAGTVPTNGAG